MARTSQSGWIVLAAALVLPSHATTTFAQDIAPGFDLFTTDPTTTHRDFIGSPIPADFFGPGSDPFDGIIALTGEPLAGSTPLCPNDILNDVDTIVERPLAAQLSGFPSEDVIPVEILELSLVSTEPIVVTYFGGIDLEYWNVEVTLSSVPSPPGTYTIARTHDNGGVFHSFLPVYHRYTFRSPDGSETRIFDSGEEGYEPHLFEVEDVPWEYADPPLGSCTSNFCAHPGGLISYQAPSSGHGLYSVCPQVSPGDIDPGFDLFTTDPLSSHRDFSDIPIPADFFGPGSDPFDGIVALVGQPVGSSPFCPSNDLSEVDTIVERTVSASLPAIPSHDTIPVEIVELSLVSSDPITVTYFGGVYLEYWDLEITLSNVPAGLGELSLTKTHENGGVFDSVLPVYLRLTFRQQGSPEVRIWDLGQDDLIDLFAVYDVPWEYVDPPPGSCTSNFCPNPGGLIPYQAPPNAHGLLSICPQVSPGDIDPGFDLFTADPFNSHRDFSILPIPADFFGPGSDPFDGIVPLAGQPIGSSPFCPNDDLSTVDTIVERPLLAQLPGIPSQDTVPIEMVELSLVSTEPVTVTYFGGSWTEQWDLEITLSTVQTVTGVMYLTKTHANGGTFDSILPVILRLSFLQQGGPEVRVWDLGEDGIVDLFEASNVPWEYSEPPAESCTSNFCTNPGGLTIYSCPSGLLGLDSHCPTVVSVADQDPQASRLHLAPAFPNPLTTSTLITYSIPARMGVTAVTLDICDVTGRWLRRLVAGPQPPGTHRVRWDGVDDTGGRVPSGVYFFRLAGGGEIASGRVAMVE